MFVVVVCYSVAYFLTYVAPVRRPANHADVGLCLLRYASGMASMWSEGAFTAESFDKDGHRSLISSHKKFSHKQTVVTNLREECLRLVCRISQKYCTVRKSQSDTTVPIGTVKNGCVCCTPSSFLPGDTIHEEDSCASNCSSDADSIFSQGSVSLYTPEEDDYGPNESDCLCDDNNIGFVGSDEDTDDDLSVEECYNDFTSQHCTTPSHQENSTDESPHLVDNLICSGDFVEYREIEANSAVKKGSIVSIESSNNLKYIVLTSGALLQPKKHAVRKVEMYCSATQERIPNPLAQWFCLDKCLLQTGTLQPEENEEYTSDEEDVPEETQR